MENKNNIFKGKNWDFLWLRMGSRTAYSLRTLLAALLAVPAAFAATAAPASLGMILDMLGSIIGPQGVGPLYQQYSYVIDFIALLLILGVTYTYGLEKGLKNSGKVAKTIGWVLAVMSSIGIQMGLQNANQTLVGVVGPIGLLVMTFVFAFMLYGMLSKVIKNNVMAFILSFDVAWLATFFLWSAVGVDSTFSPVVSMLNFLFAISLIVVPIWAILEWRKGPGGMRSAANRESQAHSQFAAHNPQVTAQNPNATNPSLDQLIRQTREQDVAEVNNQTLQLQELQGSLGSFEAVEAQILVVQQFIQKVQDGYEVAATQNADPSQVSAALKSNEAQIINYITAISGALENLVKQAEKGDQTLDTHYETKTTSARDKLRQANERQLVEEAKYDQLLSVTESYLEGAFKRIVKETNEKKDRADFINKVSGLFNSLQAFLKDARSKLPAFRTEIKNIQTKTKRLTELKEKIIGLEISHSANSKQKSDLESISETFGEFATNLGVAISQPNHGTVRKARIDGDQLIGKISEFKKREEEIIARLANSATLHQEFETAEAELVKAQTLLGQQLDAFEHAQRRAVRDAEAIEDGLNAIEALEKAESKPGETNADAENAVKKPEKDLERIETDSNSTAEERADAGVVETAVEAAKKAEEARIAAGNATAQRVAQAAGTAVQEVKDNIVRGDN